MYDVNETNPNEKWYKSSVSLSILVFILSIINFSGEFRQIIKTKEKIKYFKDRWNLVELFNGLLCIVLPIT